VASSEKENLESLADELGSRGASDGLFPVLARTSEEAVDLVREYGPLLMLTVLAASGQETFDSLRSNNYGEAVGVAGPESLKSEWGERDVTFLGSEVLDEEVYKKIVNAVCF